MERGGAYPGPCRRRSFRDFDFYSEELQRHAHVTSPLRRCVETATLLGAADAARESRIIEMDWGHWQGESLTPLRERLGDEMRDNEARGLDFRPPVEKALASCWRD